MIISDWTPKRGQIVFNELMNARGIIISENFGDKDNIAFRIEYLEASPRGIPAGQDGICYKNYSHLVQNVFSSNKL